MGNCCSKPVVMSLPHESSPPCAGDSGRPSCPPVDAVESIRGMYDKIDTVGQIDLLIRFVENQIRNMKLSSTLHISEGWLGTVVDGTKLVDQTVDTISREAERLSESDVGKEMGNLTMKVMKGMGDLHWVFIGLSVAAFGEKVCNAVGTIVEGAVICLAYLKKGYFFRFWSTSTAAAQLEKTNKQLKDVRDSLVSSEIHQIVRQTTRPPHQNPLRLLDFQPVDEGKALLDMEVVQPALAVIIWGFGGLGKSTLAASVVQSLNWSSTEFKFCRVAINEGCFRIKEAVKHKCSLLFIDNVVDKDYVRDLLQRDWSSSKEKTKLRILITSRQKNVKAELKIICKEYNVNALSHEASKRLLFETIVEDKVVEYKDFDERRMINEVAAACRGVPLLLSVFGKPLRVARNENSYQEELNEALNVLREENLNSYREEYLGTKLMFLYDKIQDVEVKEAFLDICAYFYGWEWGLVADIVDILTLEDLRRRMLVSKSDSGQVIVHDILQLMGMKEASLIRFSNYTELSDNFDGSGKVKGLSLVNAESSITIQSTQLEDMHQSLRVLILGDWVTVDGPPCFKTFTNLRYLRVGDISVFPFKDPSKLNKLRVFLNSFPPV